MAIKHIYGYLKVLVYKVNEDAKDLISHKNIKLTIDNRNPMKCIISKIYISCGKYNQGTCIWHLAHQEDYF